MSMEPKLEASPNTVRRFNWAWAGYLGLVALFFLSIWLIHKADDSKPVDWNESLLTYLPSGKILKPMALDMDEALADLFWVDGMLYFADAYMSSKTYKWMGHILDVVTILNPRFKEAYNFGGVVLTKDKGEIPLTLELLNRGIGEFPMDWRLRIYAAMARLTLDSNFIAAAEYIKPITLAPDVPNHIRTLCATYLNKGGGRRVALAFLVDRYMRSDNQINKEIFLAKILKLYPAVPNQEAIRRDTVEKILNELKLEPAIVLLALGVINEFLTGTMSPQTKNLIESLYH
jgi:hypothetical protein